LILAFGLSLAVGRYQDRRADVVADAITIGTTYLRAQTIHEAQRTTSRIESATAITSAWSTPKDDDPDSGDRGDPYLEPAHYSKSAQGRTVDEARSPQRRTLLQAT
jgi:hypothetical protein